MAEAFAGAWAARSSYRGEGAFRTWICGIVANQCRMHMRTEQRRRRWFERLEAGGDQGEPRRAEPATAAVPIETRIDLERAIGDLPPRARRSLVLRHVYGMSHAEIADAMAVSIGTVKSQIARACALLREDLSP